MHKKQLFTNDLIIINSKNLNNIKFKLNNLTLMKY